MNPLLSAIGIMFVSVLLGAYLMIVTAVGVNRIVKNTGSGELEVLGIIITVLAVFWFGSLLFGG